MWNNQLSTSKKLIDDTKLHAINYLIPDACWYGAPNGEDALPSKI
jgi:hypothetical protein